MACWFFKDRVYLASFVQKTKKQNKKQQQQTTTTNYEWCFGTRLVYSFFFSLYLKFFL